MKTIFLFLLFGFQIAYSQETFTRKDTLQGGLPFERTCFDVLRYDLNITVKPEEKWIFGANEITFKIIEPTKKIQLDLFENIIIDGISSINFGKLEWKREYNAVFINFNNLLEKDSIYTIKFSYYGNPIVAKNAPWDGGFVWNKDQNGKPFIGVAVQGTGASLWFPCKDSQSDEPDFGVTIKVAVPNDLMNVSNGRFMGSTDLKNGYTRWDWEVKNPINNYDITVNIADYVHIHDNYKGLDLDYYVLRENETKAKIHFEEVKPMMDCFQSKFGEYPFKNDGYKLVETPYLGMEHQSAVAYGNKYMKGYLGDDLSGTEIGLSFDYIIIHESGHEWFGNSITSRDIADLWIHEAFTMYSESVYVECQLGYEKVMEYVNGLRYSVENDKPIIGSYGVNNEGSVDMYYKGALMLNTVRHVINDDTKWWKLLFDYYNTFKYKIIDSETVINFFNKESGMNLTPIFNHYLQKTTIPKLDLKITKGKLDCRWTDVDTSFTMPIDVIINNKTIRIDPKSEWTSTKIKIRDIKKVQVLTNHFYVLTNQ
ncbi:M1 family metallopeptidase [Flavobacterium sp. RSB2_4_14]|uniref:M1 family metallopeptidase n=1 Tax=Flavobacterium sp. RSB2_4_14 TaxID=3447665 RepID=UPI003F2B95D7